jgi:hypothetical protein
MAGARSVFASAPKTEVEMLRLVHLLTIGVTSAVLVSRNEVRAADPTAPVRGVLVRPERVSPKLLATWKEKGATDVVVLLDETAKDRWETIARVAVDAGMTLWPWVEVARNRTMADMHPQWMATPGGHHDDWRRRFPKAPIARQDDVIKAWPWVPIGYAPAFDAHRERLKSLLAGLPGTWSGVFLNDLQAGPSSCGCGNSQCRWALDYGSPETAAHTAGDDAAARIVAELVARHPGKTVVPVWVTECEPADLPGAAKGTGLCGGVSCAKGDCWPRYARAWNPLLKATDGPIGLALWTESFERDPASWIEKDVVLFQKPPQPSNPLAPARTIAIVQAWSKSDANVESLLAQVKSIAPGWILALDPIDQSWEPRLAPRSR